MRDSWILTEAQKEDIRIFEIEPDADYDDVRGAFTWAYEVRIAGAWIDGHRRHPTRRSAHKASKAFYKTMCRIWAQRDPS